jgi:hypothetical protein
MPACASNRYHSTDAEANACIKHLSNHFDSLSTVSRVMERMTGQAGLPPVPPHAPPPAVPVAAQHQLCQAAQYQEPAVIRRIAAGVIIPASEQHDVADPCEDGDHVPNHDVNRIEETIPDDQHNDSESDIPSHHSANPTRRLERWIYNLRDPSTVVASSVREPPRVLSSYGEFHDGEDADNDNARSAAPTPEIEAQPVEPRQWYRDPVIYYLLVFGAAVVIMWVLMLCTWLLWRYQINAVEFEYLEMMRRRQYGLP